MATSSDNDSAISIYTSADPIFCFFTYFIAIYFYCTVPLLCQFAISISLFSTWYFLYFLHFLELKATRFLKMPYNQCNNSEMSLLLDGQQLICKWTPMNNDHEPLIDSQVYGIFLHKRQNMINAISQTAQKHVVWPNSTLPTIMYFLRVLPAHVWLVSL